MEGGPAGSGKILMSEPASEFAGIQYDSCPASRSLDRSESLTRSL